MRKVYLKSNEKTSNSARWEYWSVLGAVETIPRKLVDSAIFTKRSSSGQTQATIDRTSRGIMWSSQNTESFPKGYLNSILSTDCGSHFYIIHQGWISYLCLILILSLSCFETSFIEHV